MGMLKLQHSELPEENHDYNLNNLKVYEKLENEEISLFQEKMTSEKQRSSFGSETATQLTIENREIKN